MRIVLIAAMSIMFSVGMAQPNKVTSLPPRYSGVLWTFSGLPRISTWGTSGTITGLATAPRLITVDNKNGLDTLYFGIGTADTAAAKKYRIYPGEILNEWWSFANDAAVFYRVTTDSTKQIKIVIR